MLYFDRVRETTITVGTDPFALLGAVTGFQSFAVVGVAGTCPYAAVAVNASGVPTGDWEVGVGTYTLNTLTRTTVTASSNGGSIVNFGVGTKEVFITIPALNGVTNELFRQSAGLSVVGRSANGTGDVADISGADVGDVLQILVGPTLGFDAPVPLGMKLLEQHTASGSASLDFTTAITAAYDTYRIEIIDLVPATDNVSLYLRMSTNGGVSYDSGSNYTTAALQLNQGTFDGTLNGGATQTFLQFANGVDTTDAANSVNGSGTLFNPGGSRNKAVTFKTSYLNNDGNWYALTGAGRYISGTAVNAFQFLFSSGNIASGTIRVYGLVK